MQDLSPLPFSEKALSNLSSFSSSKIDQISRILLVSIQNQNNIRITNEFLHSLFKTYGCVEKAFIFDKNNVWKAYVEMDNEQSAEKAFKSLNNVNLFNGSLGGQMNIEYSNQQSLNEKNLTEMVSPKKNGLKLARSNTTQPDLISFNCPEKKNNLYQPLSYFKRSKTCEFDEIESDSSIQDEIKQEKKNNIVSLKELETEQSILNYTEDNKEISNTVICFPINGNGTKKHDIFLKFMKDFKITIPKTQIRRTSSCLSNRKISIGINTSKEPSPINKNNGVSYCFSKPNFLESHLAINNKLLLNNASNSFHVYGYNPANSVSYPLLTYASSYTSFNPNQLYLNNSTMDSFMMTGGNLISKVLYVRSLDNPFIKVEMIYNLFSNFGNITQIMYLKNKGCALVEYENTEFATISKEFLSNMKFFTNFLRIYYSNYQKIFLQKKIEQDPDTPDEIMICSPYMYRFKGSKSISINPPSNVLHISNLKMEICREDIIRKIFGQYGNIESIKFLLMENHRNMCLIKYSTVEEAFLCIAYLHNQNIEGRLLKIYFYKNKVKFLVRNVKISFTKSKI